MDKRDGHKAKITKIALIIMLVLLLVLVAFWALINRLDYSERAGQVAYGATFSHKYAAEDLGLDWTAAYWAVINELGLKKIRLVAHWDMIEERNNEYNFNDLEWMISEAAKKNIEVVLAIGRRTPRWPECHDPRWLKNLSQAEQGAELLEMLGTVVKRFQKYENITAWQVENEPFLEVFGECPKVDRELLRREVAVVRALDERPIMMTDSGELSNWENAAGLADILGTTMYKVVWTPLIGLWRYPLPPAFYHFKAASVKRKFNLDKVIVAELQAEPWRKSRQDFRQMSRAELRDSFSLDEMRANIEQVRKAGFDEAYLWGVEWWYWLKTARGDDSFWQEGRKVWQEK